MADFKTQRIRIGLEFECNGFDDHENFNEGSFKPKKDVLIIQVQGSAVLLLYTNCNISLIQYILGWKITRNMIIV